jgi:hypothetical protein
MIRDAFYEAQYELRKAEVKDYINRTDDEFTKFIIKRHKYLLQELIDVNAGGYVRKVWLNSVAMHYNTLQMVGAEVEIPDEVMAELILERLV